MRKVRATIDVDLDTGEYEVTYNNLSHPGQGIDLTETITMIEQALGMVENTVLTAGSK